MADKPGVPNSGDPWGVASAAAPEADPWGVVTDPRQAVLSRLQAAREENAKPLPMQYRSSAEKGIGENLNEFGEDISDIASGVGSRIKGLADAAFVDPFRAAYQGATADENMPFSQRAELAARASPLTNLPYQWGKAMIGNAMNATDASRPTGQRVLDAAGAVNPFAASAPQVYESGMNAPTSHEAMQAAGQGLFDIAALKGGGELGGDAAAGLNKLMGLRAAKQTAAVAAGEAMPVHVNDIAGAVSKIPGAVPEGVNILDTARDAAPTLIEQLRKQGKPLTGLQGPKQAQAAVRSGLSELQSNVDQIHQIAGGDAVPVSDTELAPIVDRLRAQEATNRASNPAKADAIAAVRHRIEGIKTMGDLRAAKSALNEETDAAQNSLSPADNPHPTQAKLDVLPDLRNLQYVKYAQLTDVPVNEIRGLMRREGALMDMRNIFDRTEPALQKAEALHQQPWGFRGFAEKVSKLGGARTVHAKVAGVESAIPENALTSFNDAINRAVQKAPSMQPQYPQPVPGQYPSSYTPSHAVGLQPGRTSLYTGSEAPAAASTGRQAPSWEANQGDLLHDYNQPAMTGLVPKSFAQTVAESPQQTDALKQSYIDYLKTRKPGDRWQP